MGWPILKQIATQFLNGANSKSGHNIYIYVYLILLIFIADDYVPSKQKPTEPIKTITASITNNVTTVIHNDTNST